ncbi:MAG TPA: secondary thiamine-phosphate synthase enzyme YjbQ [Candidatus Acidoferrales bacterium]|nr:secondary thiamine-phosphate synthase enzyme YjbQ [Candidatus Acidoferrales bacterium]
MLSELKVTTHRREEVVDVTAEVRAAVRKSGVGEGTCLVFSPHTTCGVAVNENADPAVGQDLQQHLAEVVPRLRTWQHQEGNSDAHIKAVLVGPSVTLPVLGTDLKLGRWQGVFLCEFDGPRERNLWVVVG